MKTWDNLTSRWIRKIYTIIVNDKYLSPYVSDYKIEAASPHWFLMTLFYYNEIYLKITGSLVQVYHREYTSVALLPVV